ncbi:MAG: hypothetical protein IJP93_03115 [Bacteroidales bacterium]|nr:hypothetical protein [Bacteroidales bacterium]
MNAITNPQNQSVAAINPNSLIYVNPAVTFAEIRANSELYPRLKSLDYGVSYQALVTLVAQAFTIRGQKPDGDTLAGTANLLLETLMEDPDGIGTASITFAELSRIIKKSALTVDAPVSVASLYGSIKAYAQGEGNRAREDAQKQAKEADFFEFLNQHPDYAKKVMADFENFGKTNK